MAVPNLPRLATIFYAVVALLSWGWAAVFGLPLFGEQGPTAEGVGLGVAVGLVVVLLCHVLYRLSRTAREASDTMASFFGPIGVGVAVWLALLSGFVEELCFRGALWPQLGLVGTSVFFAICHVVPMRKLALYPLFAFFAGLLFGLLRARTGSIWSPVAAHVTINALNLAYLGRMARRAAPAAPLPPPAPSPAPESSPEPDASVPDDVLDESFPLTVWRYDLRVELTGTDRETLPDCLENEDLGIFRHVPRETVYRELRDGLFVFAESFSTPFMTFASDVAAISAYLFEPVLGLEVAERYTDEETTDDVRAWKIVSLRGEWVKVPLLVPPPEDGRFVVDPEREDTDVLSAHWQGYPRWFQDGMRYKYPRLRDL